MQSTRSRSSRGRQGRADAIARGTRRRSSRDRWWPDDL